jgi:hypothetical protein
MIRLRTWHADAIQPCALTQPVQIEQVVLGSKKTGFAVMAALHNVLRDVG